MVYSYQQTGVVAGTIDQRILEATSTTHFYIDFVNVMISFSK